MAGKVGRSKVVKPEFVAESVGEGVTRSEEKLNPSDVLDIQPIVRAPGKWVKATIEEVADYEAKGLLKGYDPAKMEVLLKEGA